MGLLVFMDIVQSYAASEEMSGLSSYDGANDCYFYSGEYMHVWLWRSWSLEMFLITF